MQFVFDAPDRWLYVVINQYLAFDFFDQIMVFFSSKWAMIPVYIWLICSFYQRSKKNMLVWLLFFLLGFGLADSISSRVFKPGFKRVRPAFENSLNPRLPDGMPGSKYGFVSSHSANMFAVFGLSTMLLGLTGKQKWGLMGLAGLVAYSRVYLGVHYPGDVVFGGLLGYGIAMLLFRLWKWLCTQSPWMDKLENTIENN